MTRRLIWILSIVAVVALIGFAVTQAAEFEVREFQFRDDFGSEQLYDCYMNYYYYIRYDPPTSGSWFWAWSGWELGDKLGAYFAVGDLSMWTGLVCDPVQCHELERFRVLDFAGYGNIHPGLFCGVEFDIYCSDEYGCPIGPPLWESPPIYTGFGWWYIYVDPELCITGCSIDPGPPLASPRLLVTATHIGPLYPEYPAWGFDNISMPVQEGSPMHDESCLQALYPRPYNSYYPTIHSGFYGPDLWYCPPLWFKDQRDTTPDAKQYGYVELAWRFYFTCSGPTGVESATWGAIKAMYR